MDFRDGMDVMSFECHGEERALDMGLNGTISEEEEKDGAVMQVCISMVK
jgi:hypothetical protein